MVPLSASQPYLFHFSWPSILVFWQLLKTTRCWLRRSERCQIRTNYPICFLKQGKWEAPTTFSGMEYLSLDQHYHKCSLKGFPHLKVQYNHSQSTVAGVECQRSARLGPTLAPWGICYLHKAQRQLFRFHFALIHQHFSLLIVRIHKSCVSPHMGWGDMEGGITPALLIKSRKIRQVILSSQLTD